MTFDDVCAIATAWPGVARATSYGTPALKRGGKLLCRLWEDGQTLVVPGVAPEERAVLIEHEPEVYFLTDHYRDWPIVLMHLPAANPTAVETLLRRHWQTLGQPRPR